MKRIRRIIFAVTIWDFSSVPKDEYHTPIDWHTAMEVAKILHP